MPVAISLTAVVHLFHNFFKASLYRHEIDIRIALQFGIPASFASILGAVLLKVLSSLSSWKQYVFLGIKGNFSPLYAVIGVLFLFFATLELIPLKKYQIKNSWIAGLCSGFLGGLSGYQGAIRSTFLLHSNLSAGAFIGTSALIAVAIDLFRLFVYGTSFFPLLENTGLILTSLLFSAGGTFLGTLYMQKITIHFIRKIITAALYFIGILITLGMI